MWLRTVVFAVGLLLAENAQFAAQPDSLTRIPTRELRIPFPGTAVIRDVEKWNTLWHRFGRRRGHAGEKVQAEAPAVDFTRDMLVAVNLGPSSGCSNEARYIGEVREESDSIVVVLGGTKDTHPGPVLTCMMMIEPVDVVRLPRTELPVKFVSRRIMVPYPARWWVTPSAEELAQMEPDERRTYLKALALDPSTSPSKLEEILGSLTESDRGIASILIERHEVRRSPTMLLALSAVRETSEEARRLLLEEHGLELSRDPATGQHVLELLLSELKFGYVDPAVAAALVNNPTVRDDRELFARLLWSAQSYREIWREACDLYLQRWPRRIEERDAAGDPVPYASVPCPREAPREAPQEPTPREGTRVPLPILGPDEPRIQGPR